MDSGSIGARRTSDISLGNGSDPRPWKDADQSCSAAGTTGMLAESNALLGSAIGVLEVEFVDTGELELFDVVEVAVPAPLGFDADAEDDDASEGPARSQAEAKVRTASSCGVDALKRPTPAAWRARSVRLLPKVLSIVHCLEL
jgi:hypothetical protein